jgi:transcriptional regulator with XRE-family HTH domain
LPIHNQTCYSVFVLKAYKMDFGYYIAKQRDRLGLKQNEVAKAIGITPQSLCDMEGGRRFPRIERIPVIAEVLDLNPEYLCYLLGYWPELERNSSLMGVDDFVERMKAFRGDRNV